MAKEISDDGIPKKISVGDVWMNLHKSPPQHGRQLEAASETESSDQQDTLMGRLASRMASRDMIDELDLGPTGKSPKAKQAAIADMGIPERLNISGPAKEIKKGAEIEKEHTKNPNEAKKIAKDHLKEFPNYYNDKTGLPAMEKKLKKNETASSLMTGPGLHEQTADKEASNFSNPIPGGKVTPGANMAEQAKNQGNVFDTMHKVETTQQKVLGKLQSK